MTVYVPVILLVWFLANVPGKVVEDESIPIPWFLPWENNTQPLWPFAQWMSEWEGFFYLFLSTSVFFFSLSKLKLKIHKNSKKYLLIDFVTFTVMTQCFPYFLLSIFCMPDIEFANSVQGVTLVLSPCSFLPS